MQTTEHIEFSDSSSHNLNCALVIGKSILIGTKNAQLFVLDELLCLKHKKQLAEGVRVKKLVRIQDEMLCCICNRGTLLLLILSDEGDLLELAEKQLSRNVICGTGHIEEEIDEGEEEGSSSSMVGGEKVTG